MSMTSIELNWSKKDNIAIRLDFLKSYQEYHGYHPLWGQIEPSYYLSRPLFSIVNFID